jgi:endogenous inhibitor of DNA gyrase (YacG/DUF329 family)
MKCLQCGQIVSQKETVKIKKAGVDPFCSQYCSEIYGGIPLPYDNAIHNWLKWVDINEQNKLEDERRDNY